jgi:signal transduction histidine kinase
VSRARVRFGSMAALHPTIARIRALPPGRADALLAAALWVEAVFEVVAFAKIPAHQAVLVIALAGVQAAALTQRRRYPLMTVVVVFGIEPVFQAIGPPLTDHVAGPFFWLILAGYTLGAHTEGRRLWLGVLFASAASVAGSLVDTYDDSLVDYVSSVALVAVGPILFGQALRNRSRLNAALHAKAERAEHERAAAADAAALEERTRIAGELHDVVAHALSAMTVQASAARRMSERDPARAEAAFSVVETTGREALTELRRLLGVLRREDEELALAPQPTLAHISTLIQRARGAGLRVELRIDGEPVLLPAGVDLTAYRLIQEALRRARQAGHAGRATVHLEYEPAELRIEVTDDGAPSGRRLLGLRERVEVYGGELLAAPPEGGGWRVSARMPVGAGA